MMKMSEFQHGIFCIIHQRLLKFFSYRKKDLNTDPNEDSYKMDDGCFTGKKDM